MFSNAVLLLEVSVLLDECVHAVNHLLHQLYLAVAQPVLVGDVVCDASLATGLTAGATGLQVQVFTACLQYLHTLLGVS